MPLLTFDGKLNAAVWYGQDNQLIFGRFHATAAGSGIPLNPNRTWAIRCNADDGGVVLSGTGAAYLFSSRRLLLTAAQTGNNSFYGGCDRLSVHADESAVTGHVAGHWGFLEFKGSGSVAAKINVGGAVRGQIDMSSYATVTTMAACFLAASNNMAGTHTGPIGAFGVTTPVTGTFDAAIVVQGTGTGATSAGATKTTPGTVDSYLVAYVGATPYYIPMYASKTA